MPLHILATDQNHLGDFERRWALKKYFGHNFGAYVLQNSWNRNRKHSHSWKFCSLVIHNVWAGRQCCRHKFLSFHESVSLKHAFVESFFNKKNGFQLPKPPLKHLMTGKLWSRSTEARHTLQLLANSTNQQWHNEHHQWWATA